MSLEGNIQHHELVKNMEARFHEGLEEGPETGAIFGFSDSEAAKDDPDGAKAAMATSALSALHYQNHSLTEYFTRYTTAWKMWYWHLASQQSRLSAEVPDPAATTITPPPLLPPRPPPCTPPREACT
eukprot:1188927-Prorocentrum_minimum.AAC.1